MPIGAHAQVENGQLRLYGLIADPDGEIVFEGKRIGKLDDPVQLGEALAQELIQKGALKMVERLPKII